MSWMKPDEPFAKPPRLKPVRPSTSFAEPLAIDRGWAELTDTEIVSEAVPSLHDCEQLTIGDSRVTGWSLATGEKLTLEVFRSNLEGCDLSQVTIRSLRSSRIEACKLTGTDLSGATISDVLFERCTFRFTNLRMAKLSRVEFLDCTMDEIDGYQLTAEDVALPGTTLNEANLDQLDGTRIDLREADELSFSAMNRFDGCLITEQQLPALSHALAFAAGLDIEHSG